MATKLWFRKAVGNYTVYTRKPIWKESTGWDPGGVLSLRVRDFNRLFPHLRQAKIGKEPVAVTVTIKVGGK